MMTALRDFVFDHEIFVEARESPSWQFVPVNRVDSSRQIATLYATGVGTVDRAAEDIRDQGRLNRDDRYTLMRYAHFRAAAEYVAAAFAGIPTVSRVVLFGSVASSARVEPGRARARRGHLHEPKDVDLAVWLDDATGLDRLVK